MFYVRPIARDDLPAILALSERTGTGLTTLPANRERLASRIERSLASFARQCRCRRCVLHVRARRAPERRERPRGRHQRDRGGRGLEGALVQLSRRNAGSRLAPARRLHRRRRRCSSPTTTPATPSFARCFSTRRSARARTACCSPSAGSCSSPSSPSGFRRRSSPSCAAASTATVAARSGKASDAISSRWSTPPRIT